MRERGCVRIERNSPPMYQLRQPKLRDKENEKQMLKSVGEGC